MKKNINWIWYSNTTLHFFLSAVLIFGSMSILDLIYRTKNTAYIDEIFHVPQAQLYCMNLWSKWDPKITTPPGLYLISYVILKPFEKLGFQNFCSLFALRTVNVIGTTLNFFIIFKISCSLDKKYNNKSQSTVAIFSAFNIAIFPPLYFFSFLYYTDVWSTTFVLLMYYSHLSKGKFNKITAAFSSLIAVLMRQTNIVWVGLMIIDKVWNILDKNIKPIPVQDFSFTVDVFTQMFSDYFSLKKEKRKSLIQLIARIMLETYHYIIVCSIFIAFVIINGGIVLGDRRAHSVVFHPMQNLYFLAFIAFFGLPFFLFELPSILKKPPNILLLIFLTGLFTTLSEINKLEHPYLLADNRHLSFYIWKKIFGHQVVRWLVVPIYVCSGMLLKKLLEKRCHYMFMIGLCLCTLLNLTPQYLFELRYFIIPFVMFRLQFKQSYVVLLETLFFVSINAGVIYLFISRTFVWTSEADIYQRIIW